MAEMRESNKRSIESLTVDIDCSDALKGLKAVTREAKKATAALKELEEQQSKIKYNSKRKSKFICLDCNHIFEGDSHITDGRRCPSSGVGLILPMRIYDEH